MRASVAVRVNLSLHIFLTNQKAVFIGQLLHRELVANVNKLSVRLPLAFIAAAIAAKSVTIEVVMPSPPYVTGASQSRSPEPAGAVAIFIGRRCVATRASHSWHGAADTGR